MWCEVVEAERPSRSDILQAQTSSAAQHVLPVLVFAGWTAP